MSKCICLSKINLLSTYKAMYYKVKDIYSYSAIINRFKM